MPLSHDPGHGQVDFAEATTFNLDEFLGVSASHPGSYRAFMERHLFSHVNVPPKQVHFLNGIAADPDDECRRSQRSKAEWQPVPANGYRQPFAYGGEGGGVTSPAKQ